MPLEGYANTIVTSVRVKIYEQFGNPEHGIVLPGNGEQSNSHTLQALRDAEERVLWRAFEAERADNVDIRGATRILARIYTSMGIERAETAASEFERLINAAVRYATGPQETELKEQFERFCRSGPG